MSSPEPLSPPLPTPADPCLAGAAGQRRPVAAIRSDALLGGQSELVICHGDGCYRLRLTRQGKLILTK